MTLGESPPGISTFLGTMGGIPVYEIPEWPPPDAPRLEIHDDYAELNGAVLDTRLPSLLPEPGVYALVRIGDLP